MSLNTHHERYSISVGGDPADLQRKLSGHPQIVPLTIQPLSGPERPEEEEVGIAEQDIAIASLPFERTRAQVREALRAIVGVVFDSFDLPRSNGIDFGCGATGEMTEELLPATIERSRWVQVDINPAAVKENRRRHQHSTVMRGSYLDIYGTLAVNDQLDIVTGLSSLDATQFLHRAIGEIRDALKAGGYFLHMQDVRPGLGVGFREMEHMGFNPPYKVDALNTHPYDPLFYKTPAGTFSVGELFRRQLGREIEETPGMELVMNTWVTARRNLPSEERMGRRYFLNILFPQFELAEEASAVVTLARKAV